MQDALTSDACKLRHAEGQIDWSGREPSYFERVRLSVAAGIAAFSTYQPSRLYDLSATNDKKFVSDCYFLM